MGRTMCWAASAAAVTVVAALGEAPGRAGAGPDGGKPPAGIGPDLDIKPGSCPNSINRNSNGVLPVALVGTADFDVTDVDLSTVVLVRADGVGGAVPPIEGPPGPHSVFEDVATPFDGPLCECHELEGDGIVDLSMKFPSDEVTDVLQLDGVAPGASVELCVQGELMGGGTFEACDCIRIVPPSGGG